MKNFSLSDMHFVGDEILDSQHALILSCMANISEYILAEIKGRDLFEVIDRLDAYCKLHFLEEEKMMEKMNFAEVETHKARHAQFVTHLEHFLGRSEVQNRKKNIEELASLKDCFLEHIVMFGKQYSERSECTLRLNEAAAELGH